MKRLTLLIIDQDGVVQGEVRGLHEYDLSKAVARADLCDDIQRIQEQAKKEDGDGTL